MTSLVFLYDAVKLDSVHHPPTPTPLVSAGVGGGGLSLPTKFSKKEGGGGGLTGPKHLEGSCLEIGSDFFQGGFNFHKKIN